MALARNADFAYGFFFDDAPKLPSGIGDTRDQAVPGCDNDCGDHDRMWCGSKNNYTAPGGGALYSPRTVWAINSRSESEFNITLCVQHAS